MRFHKCNCHRFWRLAKCIISKWFILFSTVGFNFKYWASWCRNVLLACTGKHSQHFIYWVHVLDCSNQSMRFAFVKELVYRIKSFSSQLCGTVTWGRSLSFSAPLFLHFCSQNFHKNVALCTSQNGCVNDTTVLKYSIR